MSPTLTVLFLGAGKRLSLLERFLAAAAAEGVRLRLMALERSPMVPIASVADVRVGAGFRDPEFPDRLLTLVRDEDVDLIIPNMDAATVALSGLRGRLSELGAAAIVSDAALCSAMEDKVLAERWFAAHGTPTPAGSGWPRIAKHRFGFGSRDQAVLHDEAAESAFFLHRSREEYLVQAFVAGPEFSVDAFVGEGGMLMGALSRERLTVTDGEVETSRTYRHSVILELTRRVLAEPGWRGPITLQFIDGPDGPKLIEINPRFGGGVTHAIHCGLDMPRWLLRERLGRVVEPVHEWPDGSVMTRARRDVFL